ncbi:MAG TPA: metallophosphoesterase [Allosphingosinicella sp.]|nr:metallophosphoesterase [Allosphingosinicella sp.]
MRRWVRVLQRLFLGLVFAGILLVGFAYWTAVSDPVARNARIAVAGWPAGEPGLRLLLLSDIHVGGPDMPPERLRRIVGQINRLSPDIVLIAGDFVTDKRLATHHYSHDEAVAPLAGLRPRLATVAVLGNHDHWRDAAAARRALARAGIRLLENDAVQLGPVAVGGLDDDFTDRADLPRTLAALRRLRGPKLILSHSPDPFADPAPDVFLMLAGHTHCGQVSPPLVGPLSTMSDHGRRYACGLVRERGRILVVTAGLGTSGIPLRLGAVPDMWLVEIGPRSAGRR